MKVKTQVPVSSVEALSMLEFGCDAPGIAIPRPEVHVVVRFGAAARDGLDLHALGVRETVHRKHIRGGQRVIAARLRLGTCSGVLGLPASELGGRAVPLEDLWGDGATHALRDRLSRIPDPVRAATSLHDALATRPAMILLRAGHERLASASVRSVASDLGVSERHLRRLFHEIVGVSPKVFTRITRFRRALRAAREGRESSWSAIAADTGYCDQAHLIDEFRAITGATPSAFLFEY